MSKAAFAKLKALSSFRVAFVRVSCGGGGNSDEGNCPRVAADLQTRPFQDVKVLRNDIQTSKCDVGNGLPALLKTNGTRGTKYLA